MSEWMCLEKVLVQVYAVVIGISDSSGWDLKEFSVICFIIVFDRCTRVTHLMETIISILA